MVMKKVFFSMFLAFVAQMNVNAQEVQLATLQKVDGTQLFYGADAFKEAIETADHGDVIILTPGSFNVTTLTKAVSIYGAGYEMDANMEADDTGESGAFADNELPKYPTRLVGDFSIALDSINDQAAEGLYIEGICCSNVITVTKELTSATFVKCDFYRLQFGTDALVASKNCFINQCKLTQFNPGKSTSMVVSNSFLGTTWQNNDASTLLIRNSIIQNLNNELRGTLQNSIIFDVYHAVDKFYFDWAFHPSGNSQVWTNSAIYHCFFGNINALKHVITKDGNWVDSNLATILFGESNSSYYKLTDEAKVIYVGTDGKEIGIYGGTSPFNPILTIPRVVKKDIASETVDGKLKVNIKVETGDYSL